jgi:hypothetical protein
VPKFILAPFVEDELWAIWQFIAQEPTPIALSVPHSRLTVWAARLSFCLGGKGAIATSNKIKRKTK